MQLTPIGLTQRGYRTTDAPTLASLLSLLEQRSDGHATTTPAELVALIDALIHEPGEQIRLTFSEDGTLVAAGLNIAPPPGGFRFDAMGGVHPDWRGLGIGRALLAQQLRQAATLHDAAGADAPWQFRAKSVVDNTTATRLYERFGLEPVRHWYSMTARIGVHDPQPVPDGLRIAEYAPADEADTHALHMQAFADHWQYQDRSREQWAGITVRAPTFLPRLSLMAADAHGLAGYVLSYEGAEPGRLVLGQSAVRRDWRRRGLATALVSQVLARASAEGKHTAELSTDAANPSGAVSVGLRNGFTIETHSVTYATGIG